MVIVETLFLFITYDIVHLIFQKLYIPVELKLIKFMPIR